MSHAFEIAGVEMRIVRKDVRHLHLNVLPPDGRVRITAPPWMETESVRLFVLGKLGWIKRQRQKMSVQARETPRDYIDRESHFVWGQRYLLQIVEHDATPQVELRHKKLVMRVRPGSDAARREAVLSAWYRNQLRNEAQRLLGHWVPLVGRRPDVIHIQKMKTKWGSCNPAKGSIRLNTELAKKPPECLEYILLHELVHLLDPTHGPQFIATMDQLLPQWRDRREALNRLPLG